MARLNCQLIIQKLTLRIENFKDQRKLLLLHLRD